MDSRYILRSSLDFLGSPATNEHFPGPEEAIHLSWHNPTLDLPTFLLYLRIRKNDFPIKKLQFFTTKMFLEYLDLEDGGAIFRQDRVSHSHPFFIEIFLGMEARDRAKSSFVSFMETYHEIERADLQSAMSSLDLARKAVLRNV